MGDSQLKMVVAKLESRTTFWWQNFTKQGCIFVHVPKCAGTSIEGLLYNVKIPASQHFTARELRRMWPSKFKALPSFAILRNPLERAISAYKYIIGGGNGKSNDVAWKLRLGEKFRD